MGVIETMGNRGDTKCAWNRNNDDEVANARRTFDDMKKKGYQAFRTDSSGNKTTKMETFDPNAESIIMVPQLKGG